MEIKRFLGKLSSDTPTPGGGSASALAGALSASLVVMVAGLSSKRGDTNLKGAARIRKRGLFIQERLFRAIDEDSKSFDAVIEAFRLPQSSERMRLRRARQIQKAYREATLTPRQVCQQSLRLLEYSRALVSKGNPKAISDAGVAAFLADAAFAGGMLNIKINLGGVTEKTFVKRMNALMRDWSRKRNQLMKVTIMKLTGFSHV